jgi:D-lactate dehydrogenase
MRVPAYSPESVAEHALALIMTLARKTHKAYNRVREGNFSLVKLTGFNIHGKTIGVIGTGQIGKAFCRIMKGMGTHIIAHMTNIRRMKWKSWV